jgi:hypothetical protein
MRTLRGILVVATIGTLGAASVVALGQGGQQLNLRTSDLMGFSVGVERASDSIVLTCERGCDWKTLRVDCGEKKKCESKINDLGKVGDDKTPRPAAFLFTVEGTKDGMAFGCQSGCAWHTLAFGCGEKTPCASKINEYGLAKEIR